MEEGGYWVVLRCVQEFMAEIEVRAAHNVLEACAQADTIHKVVFTSSATAVVWTDDCHADVDERNWSDVNLCKKFKVGNFRRLCV